MQTLEIDVGGMACASCAARVERALDKLPGVIEACVNLASENTRVRHSPASAGLPEFRNAIGEVGYEVPAQATQAADSAGDGDTHTTCRGKIPVPRFLMNTTSGTPDR